LAPLGLAVAPLLLLALYGFFRLRRMRDVLDPDWRILVEFGGALRALSDAAWHDPRALRAVIALAPDVEALLLTPGSSPLADRLEPLARPPGAPPSATPSPAPDPTGAGHLDLAGLREQVFAAERLLQAEMKRLNASEASLSAWFREGVSGIVLFFAGSLG